MIHLTRRAAATPFGNKRACGGVMPHQVHDVASARNGLDNGHQNRLSFLGQVKLFQTLSESERRVVRDASRMVSFRRRRRIYMPGDPGDRLFVLKSGTVKLNVVSPEGREIILSFLHPGDVFGELAVIDTRPRDHIAEAYEDIVACSIRSDVLQRMTQESPRLSVEMMRLLGIRQRSYRTRVEELLYKSAHARVAHTLLSLAGHHGVEDADGVFIRLRLSQRDIANLVGLTRETVNFILKDLRQRNLIETQGRSIRVRSPELLHVLC